MSEAVVAGTSERLIRDVSHTPQEVWLEYWLTCGVSFAILLIMRLMGRVRYFS